MDNGRATETLSGLVYSATPRKLLFRLIASDSDFDKAEQAWRAAMTTLRTVSGKLPSVEDPNRKVTPEEVKAATGKPEHVTVLVEEKPKKSSFRKAEVVIECSAAGRKLQLRVPAGWSGQKGTDGIVSLRHADLSMQLQVSVLSSLDGDEPAAALNKATAGSLVSYSTVRKREDPKVAPNAAGASVAAVWRWGDDASGSVVSCDAAGASGDFYWLLSYRGKFPAPSTKDVKLLEALMKTMSVELAP